MPYATPGGINKAASPLCRMLFRARSGDPCSLLKTMAQAVEAVSRHADGGLWLHDLRHSYESWFITAGVSTPTYSG